MIVGLSILIGAIGLCILLVLLLQTLQTIHSTKKYSSQSKQAGMVDLLNYASLVDDGVISVQNGSLMAAWMYSGRITQAQQMPIAISSLSGSTTL